MSSRIRPKQEQENRLIDKGVHVHFLLGAEDLVKINGQLVLHVLKESYEEFLVSYFLQERVLVPSGVLVQCFYGDLVVGNELSDFLVIDCVFFIVDFGFKSLIKHVS